MHIESMTDVILGTLAVTFWVGVTIAGTILSMGKAIRGFGKGR